MTRNEDVVEEFFNGRSDESTTNLHIENDKLINYYTVLAERVPREDGEFHFILNQSKYSRTTSAIQTLIKRYAQGHSHETVEEKPMGVYTLQPLQK